MPPGPVLSDVLIGSPIFQGEGGDFGGGGAEGGAAPFEFGVDPNMDPELALALRVSLEEERARQNTTVSAQAHGLCMPRARLLWVAILVVAVQRAVQLPLS